MHLVRILIGGLLLNPCLGGMKREWHKYGVVTKSTHQWIGFPRNLGLFALSAYFQKECCYEEVGNTLFSISFIGCFKLNANGQYE